VKRASKLGSPSRRWVTDVARKYGLGLTSKAVDHAVERGKNRFGWVVEAVKAWSVEGVPDYLEDDVSPEELRRDVWATFGPGGTHELKHPAQDAIPAFIPVPIQDDRPAHLAWANSPHPFLRKLAAQALGRNG
jgi:hypothetical protein